MFLLTYFIQKLFPATPLKQKGNKKQKHKIK